jgi:FtsH-binding integral membrane protein
MASSVTTAILGPVFTYIVQPLIFLITAFALLVFVWGVAALILNREDSEKVNDAKRHILWGVIGIFIMISAFGIVRFVGSSLGMSIPLF